MLEDLIAFLRFHDFPVGVDTHLKVGHLLDRLGEQYPTDRLKTMLAPLFAVDPFQQEEFYKLYDAYLAQFPLGSSARGDQGKNSKGFVRSSGIKAGWWLHLFSTRRFYILLQALMMVGIGYLGVRAVDCYLNTGDPAEAWRCFIGSAHLQRSSAPLEADSLNLVLPDTNALAAPAADPADTFSSQPSPLRLDRSTPHLAQQIELPLLDLDAPDLSSLQKPWYARYELVIRLVLALFFLSFAIFVELRDRLRRRLLLMEDRQRQPPLFWRVKGPDKKLGLYQPADFFEAAKVLREREPYQSQEVDVEKTVERSTRNGGYVQLAYQTHSRPPEYLVLIEQQSSQDLLARLYDQIYGELQQQDLYLERYFFEKDPRVCWQKRYADEHYLEELLRQRPEHRLVIVAGVEAFFDRFDGQLADWLPLLYREKPVFLLTPEVPSAWGSQEAQLQEHFFLLPATIEGLARIPQALHKSAPASLQFWQELNAYPPLPASAHSWSLSELERYFDTDLGLAVDDRYVPRRGHRLFIWCCACGLYPELNWEMILALAETFETEQAPLRTPRNLYKLLRLPWFRQGRMPLALREAMQTYLSPGQIQQARHAIVRVLRENPPPEGSYAHDEYQLQLRVQEAELEGGLREDFEALQEVWDYSLHHEVEDEVVLRYLKELPYRRVGGQVALPKAVSETVFRQGIPALGLKAWVRGGLAMLVVILIGLTFSGYQWSNWERYEQQWYYLANAADSIRYHTYVGVDQMKQGQWNAAQRNLELAQSLGKQQNTPVLEPTYYLAYLAWQQGNAAQRELALASFSTLTTRLEPLTNDSSLSDPQRQGYQQLYQRSLYSLGVLQFEQENTDLALQAFREASKADEGNLSARLGEALALVQQSSSQPANTAATDKLTLATDRLSEIANRDPRLIGQQAPLVRMFDSLQQQASGPLLKGRYQQLLAVARGQDPTSVGPETLGTDTEATFTDLKQRRFNLITDYQAGLAVVESEGKYGFVNRNNELQGGLAYQDAQGFSEGLAAVKQNGRWGYVDRNQSLVIGYRYQRAEPFRDGWAAVRNPAGYWGIIDRKGQVQLPFAYEKPVIFEPEANLPPGAESLAAVYVDREPEGKYTYLRKDGSPAFEGQLFQYAENFQGDYARVVRYDQSYYINRQGNCVKELSGKEGCPTEKWGKQLIRTIPEHQMAVVAADFSANGQQLLTASMDSTVRLWTDQGRSRGVVLRHQDWVRCIAQNATGSRIYSGSRDGRIYLWDAQGQMVNRRSLGRLQPWSMVYQARSDRLFVGLSNGEILQLDIRTLETLNRWRTPRDLKVNDLAVSGRWLAAVYNDGILRLWNLADGSQRQLTTGRPIQRVAIDPQGERLAIGNRRGEIEVYDIEQLQPQRRYRPHQGWVVDLAFAPFGEGQYLLSASQDRSLRVYDLSRENRVFGITLRTSITAAGFEQTGNTLVVATQGPTGRGLDQVLLFSLDRY